MRLKRVMLIAAVMVMAGAFTGCGKKEEKPEQPKIEKEEEEILKKAGKCEKCGRPFKIKNGRWEIFIF